MKTIPHIKAFLFIIILGIALSGTKAYAQEGSAEERANTLTMSMNCELGLYYDQIPKVNAINLEAAQKMDAARQQAGTDMRKFHKLGKQINEDRNIKLRDVLTPTQFSMYERISRGNRMALKKTAHCRKEMTLN